MGIQVLMPALSPTMTEGKLARWLKKVGDEVRAGDVIAEIETDKATMEVEAVDEGMLSQILVDEGTDGVAVNTPIAELSGGSERGEWCARKGCGGIAARGGGRRGRARDRRPLPQKNGRLKSRRKYPPSTGSGSRLGPDTPDHRARGFARRDGAGNAP